MSTNPRRHKKSRRSVDSGLGGWVCPCALWPCFWCLCVGLMRSLCSGCVQVLTVFSLRLPGEPVQHVRHHSAHPSHTVEHEHMKSL